ncbi:transposase [Kitasatospora purpeofusca]|uniref:transposase n=1 Tax=Kitasatospora purpeofusca TaxID=67352 RepID=UPI00365E76DC
MTKDTRTTSPGGKPWPVSTVLVPPRPPSGDVVRARAIVGVELPPAIPLGSKLTDDPVAATPAATGGSGEGRACHSDGRVRHRDGDSRLWRNSVVHLGLREEAAGESGSEGDHPDGGSDHRAPALEVDPAAGKKVKGRKRFIVTDTLGLLLAVYVIAANIQGHDGAKHPRLWTRLDHPGVQRVWADQGFADRLVEWARAILGRELEIVHKAPDQRGVPGPAQAMGHRADLLLDHRAPAPRPGLRAAACPLRDHDPLGGDRHHGPPTHPQGTSKTTRPTTAFTLCPVRSQTRSHLRTTSPSTTLPEVCPLRRCND